MSPITAQIRSAYYDSGLTTLQIAMRAEVNKRTVLRILSGRHVRTDKLLAVCGVLGVHDLRLGASPVTSAHH